MTATWSPEAVFQGRWRTEKHEWEIAGPKIPMARVELSSDWILPSCSLKSVYCLPHSYWYSNFNCGTSFRLLGERWFHMNLDSPPPSPLGKHSKVTAPCISTAPLFLCTFISGLCDVSAHFIIPSWHVVTQLANARIPTLPMSSVGFLLTPFSPHPRLSETYSFYILYCSCWARMGPFPKEVVLAKGRWF